jgi:beta-glucanase (GH16 family)
MIHIQRFSILLAIAALSLHACTQKKDIVTDNSTQVITEKNWQFENTPVWADEFDGSTVNTAKWTFETGGSGWGNNELQYYSNGSNSRIENGNLIIEARKESSNGRDYTSSRMITRGKGDWLYGRFIVRAKLPKGRGTWPAIWMLSTDNTYGNWPASGEIDIMEHVGYDPGNVHFSIHSQAYNHIINTQKTATKYVASAMDDFHTYRLDWTPFAIRGYIDDAQYFEFTNQNQGYSAWPFNKRFFMILNVAVGGNWGGVQGVDNNIFPQSMQVDYVRVYKMIE